MTFNQHLSRCYFAAICIEFPTGPNPIYLNFHANPTKTLMTRFAIHMLACLFVLNQLQTIRTRPLSWSHINLFLFSYRVYQLKFFAERRIHQQQICLSTLLASTEVERSKDPLAQANVAKRTILTRRTYNFIRSAIFSCDEYFAFRTLLTKKLNPIFTYS